MSEQFITNAADFDPNSIPLDRIAEERFTKSYAPRKVYSINMNLLDLEPGSYFLSVYNPIGKGNIRYRVVAKLVQAQLSGRL